jgi:hypothetical protein
LFFFFFLIKPKNRIFEMERVDLSFMKDRIVIIIIIIIVFVSFAFFTIIN